MSDVVVTVPKRFEHAGFRGLTAWAAEGCLPGEAGDGRLYEYSTYGARPDISPGERVYIVCEDRVRGFAALVRLEFLPRVALRPDGGVWHQKMGHVCLIRSGGAQAVTVPAKVVGFRGWRYRWWRLEQEIPFPDWLPDIKREAIAAAYGLDGPGEVR